MVCACGVTMLSEGVEQQATGDHTEFIQSIRASASL
jgi:hypothetical protein